MQGRLKFLDDWYEKTKALARHKHATPTLCVLSFTESSFFPIPVDVMLIPMVQAAPHRWWKLAMLSTIFSVLGGILGYMIGLLFFETLAQPILESLGKAEKMEMFRASINKHGGLWVFGAGLTPFPYKVITIRLVSVFSLRPVSSHEHCVILRSPVLYGSLASKRKRS